MKTMALWHRINQSKIKFLSHQLKRYHVQTPYASFSIHTVQSSSSYALASPVQDVCRRPPDLFYKVRFFATSYQGKAKKDEKANRSNLLNDEIIAQFVRLVTDEGHFVVPLREARERAKKLNLDLVQVQGNVDPPVCKIMDFKRVQYKRKMQDKERAKEKKEVSLKKGGCKEVRFLDKTELKDLKMKADSVVRLMQRGYRVKCMAVGSPKKGGRAAASLRGPGGEDLTEEEIAELKRKEEEEEKERLKEVLSRLTALLGDEYILESGPRAAKQQAYVIVRHAKFGPKKGGSKKLKDAVKVSTSNSDSVTDEEDSEESGTETEDESLSDEDSENTWSVTDTGDDFDRVFDVKSDAKEPSHNYTGNVHVVPEVKSSGSNFNASQFRPVNDARQEVIVPSSPEQPFEENRYKRSELRERFSPAPLRDSRAPEPTRVPYPPQQSFEAENRYIRSEPRDRFSPLPTRDSRAPDTVRVPYPPQQSFEAENQYKRSETRGQIPLPLVRDNRAPDRRDSSRIPPPQFSNRSAREQYPPTPPRDNRAPNRIDSFRMTPPPHFSNQTGQTQSGTNLSPATGDKKPDQTDSSGFRTPELQKQPNLRNAPNARPSSYGIFSTPNTSTPGKLGVASQVHKNTEEKPHNLSGNSNTGGFGSGQGRRDDGRQQPRWGIFSKDGPNVNPNRISK